MLKKTWLLALAVIALTLTGCGRTAQMDKLNGDLYSYRNESLNFKIDLPKDFIYYQVQIKNGKIGTEETTDWKDVDILVPLKDATFTQDVPGYAKAMTIRVFQSGKYKETLDFEKLIEGNSGAYAIRFWKKQPKEWEKIWGSQMEDSIKKSLQVIK